MKKSINISDIMINSDRFYQASEFQTQKSQTLNNYHSHFRHIDEKMVLSPWIERQEQKSFSPKNYGKVLDHSFLNRINFKNKAKISKTQRITNDLSHRAQKQYNKQEQQVENIILFPKTATKKDQDVKIDSNKKETRSFYKQHPDEQLFSSTRTKWRDRKIKKSTIISLNIDTTQAQTQQINPEKYMSLTKSKGLSTYQKSQKRKELLKFKIKQNQKHRNPQTFEKKLQLQKYLKMMTELPQPQQKISKGKIRTLQPKPYHQNKSLNLQNKSGLIICQGQPIVSKTFRRFSVKKINTQGHYQETVFLC